MDIEDSRQRLKDISLSANNNEPSHEDQVLFYNLSKKAREAAEAGQPKVALECYQKASKIRETDKVVRRIAKLEAYLKEYGSDESEEEDDGMVHVGKGFSVYKDVYNKMYSHQKEALLWFWGLHRKKKGGILGDDMGLGKTIQVIVYLSGLFDMEQVRSVLLILPVAVIINWEKEFEKWAPGITVETFHGGNKCERLRTLAKVQRNGGVLMTSYGLIVTSGELIGSKDGRQFVWDYTILDEGHKIKNPTETNKACRAIASNHRFILTGTPISNNLKEFWHLLDFVTQGTLLGTKQTFQREYGKPITRSREKDATASEKMLGNLMAKSLRQIIAPYFLRRTKADVLEKKEENQSVNDPDVPGTSGTGKAISFPTLTQKTEFVVWCFLTDKQIKIYKDFLELDHIKELLMTIRSPLVELTVLKKLCDHLRILSVRACMQLGMDTGAEDFDEEDESLTQQSAVNTIQHISTAQLMEESGKLQFLMDLLKKLSMDGHRTLVFSQSRKMLDIIERLLNVDNYKYLRMDGTMRNLEDRQQTINSFQRNRSYSVFLLTTKVGGVGLTLTGADRVVIFDPCWNPATDKQAVDRVYRIGQKESVVVYRLITCGTVEEKIYRRQIFKESINKQTVGCTAAAKNPYRYFTRGELKDLFTLDNPWNSTTQVALEQMHGAQRKTDTELDSHIAFLYSLEMFGISDHDLMFSKEAVKDHSAEAENYVQQRAQRAEELVSAEGDLKQILNDRMAEEDPNNPGTRNRLHTLYTDRQQLLQEAARLGRDVELPGQQPRWTDRPPLDRPTQAPLQNGVDLINYEDSFNDSKNNVSHISSVAGNDSFNDSRNNVSNVSSASNSSFSNSRGNISHVSSVHGEVQSEVNASFLQDIISNLSQEELELNMRMLELCKANQSAQQQVQHQTQQQAQYKVQQQADISYHDDIGTNEETGNESDDSSILEEVNLSSSTGAEVESSYEEVEVADQRMQAEYADQVQRAQELVSAEGDLKQILNDRIAEEDPNNPGTSNRRHTLFTDRQQLLQEAAPLGHDVELPGQRPRWTDRPPLDRPKQAPPQNGVDLTNYEDSFNDSQNNMSHISSAAPNDSLNDSEDNVSHVSSASNSSFSNSRGNISHVSSVVQSEENASFLQDIISNLSEEELELNMRMLELCKANQSAQQQVQHQTQLQAQYQVQQQADISYHDDIGTNKETGNESDDSSILEEVNLSSSTGAEMKSSYEEVEVANQRMQAEYADQEAVAESSMEEEVEVADQSLQASLNGTRGEEDEGRVNVSSMYVTEEDEMPQDATDLSMDDLAAADELDCDDLDLHIPAAPHSVRKSFSAIPSTLVRDTAKGPYRRQVQSVEDSFNQSDGAKKACLVPDSPNMPVQSDDETETGMKRKSEFIQRACEGKRKFTMEDSFGEMDSGKSIEQFSKFQSLGIRDLDDKDDSPDNSGVFSLSNRDRDNITSVIHDSEEELEGGLDTNPQGSYISASMRNPIGSFDENEAPTAKEMLQRLFDDVSLSVSLHTTREEVGLNESTGIETCEDEEEDGAIDETGGSDYEEEDVTEQDMTNDEDNVELENDTTNDSSLQSNR